MTTAQEKLKLCVEEILLISKAFEEGADQILASRAELFRTIDQLQTDGVLWKPADFREALEGFTNVLVDKMMDSRLKLSNLAAIVAKDDVQ